MTNRLIPNWLRTELALPTVAHACRDQTCGGEYECPGCERTIPYCVGGHDSLGELCDDCACHVWYLRGDAEAEQGIFREGP